MARQFTEPFAQNGDREEIPDAQQTDGEVSYDQGYTINYQREVGVDPLALSIERAKFNGIMNDVTSALIEFQQYGAPLWVQPSGIGVDTGYAKNAWVRYSDGNVYISLIDSNNSIPTNTTNWKKYGTGDYLALNTTVTINASIDWNTILTPGIYNVTSTSGANAAPETFANGVLLVLRNNDSGNNTITQQYYPASTDTKKVLPYVRSSINNTASNWSAWVKTASSADFPSNFVPYYPTSIAPATDWNTLTDPGIYNALNANNTNAPGPILDMGQGSLFVSTVPNASGTTNPTVLQIYASGLKQNNTDSSYKLAYRIGFKTVSTTPFTWSVWQALATSQDVNGLKNWVQNEDHNGTTNPVIAGQWKFQNSSNADNIIPVEISQKITQNASDDKTKNIFKFGSTITPVSGTAYQSYINISQTARSTVNDNPFKFDIYTQNTPSPSSSVLFDQSSVTFQKGAGANWVMDYSSNPDVTGYSVWSFRNQNNLGGSLTSAGDLNSPIYYKNTWYNPQNGSHSSQDFLYGYLNANTITAKNYVTSSFNAPDLLFNNGFYPVAESVTITGAPPNVDVTGGGLLNILNAPLATGTQPVKNVQFAIAEKKAAQNESLSFRINNITVDGSGNRTAAYGPWVTLKDNSGPGNFIGLAIITLTATSENGLLADLSIKGNGLIDSGTLRITNEPSIFTLGYTIQLQLNPSLINLPSFAVDWLPISNFSSAAFSYYTFYPLNSFKSPGSSEFDIQIQNSGNVYKGIFTNMADPTTFTPNNTNLSLLLSVPIGSNFQGKSYQLALRFYNTSLA